VLSLRGLPGGKPGGFKKPFLKPFNRVPGKPETGKPVNPLNLNVPPFKKPPGFKNPPGLKTRLTLNPFLRF
jgi:hypothetical protein